MPTKNVREMNAFQRSHHSLRGKAFRAIFLIAAVLGVCAVLFGFFLFRAAVSREYRIRTYHLAKTAAMYIDRDEVQREAEAVVSVYAAMTPDEQAKNDEGYLARFAAAETDSMQALRKELLALQKTNGAIAAYTAFLDPETQRMVFIADADPKDTVCPPGHWDAIEEPYFNAFLNGAKVTLLDRLYDTPSMPSVTMRMEQYGYRCTAGEKLMDVGGYPVYIFYDTDMSDVAKTSRMFLIQFVVLLLLITALTIFFSMLHLKRAVVKPINALAEAAEAYTRDRSDTDRDSRHFAKLNIRTGDEIENLCLTMQSMEDDLGDYIRNLTHVTAEKERLGTELSLATRIQADMLPNIFPAFPGRPEFDVFAAMEPAKEVGGDFYDFFLIDEDHLGIVIADVSGKGIPAALFMMISKILIQNNAMGGKSPKEVMQSVNDQICKNNREQMFVTVWFGILDVVTGVVTAANAGHEYPIIRKPDGSFEVYKDKHGFILGGMADTKYREYSFLMEPGSRLFLYTDGVTEATDANGKMFGTDRLLSALNAVGDASPEDVLHGVRSAIGDFVKDAEQFDDLTMLCVEYRGAVDETGAPKKDGSELTVDAILDNLPRVQGFVDTHLTEMNCPMKLQMQIDIALEEVFVNIAHYAYAPDTGTATVRVKKTPDVITITLIDSGHPYDPLAKDDPDVTLSADEREIGVLGIFMTKQIMDDLSYARKNGRNILTMRKALR